MDNLRRMVRQAIDQDLSGYPPPPPDLRNRVAAHVVDQAAGQQRDRPHWLLVAIAVIVALVLVPGLLLSLRATVGRPQPGAQPAAPIGSASAQPSSSLTWSPTAAPTSTALPGTAGVPPARQGAAMAWDPKDGYVLMFGGGNVQSSNA